MKVAEITITYGSHFSSASIMSIGFEDTDKAAAEFARLNTYLDRREARANDVEKIVTVSGINSFTCNGSEINGVGYVDYVRENAATAGVKDAFPNIFKS
jgi:hypothetical protein